MKTITHSQAIETRQWSVTATIVLAMGMMVMSAAALNNGTPLATSVFDALETVFTSLLSSTMVLVFVFIALIVTVWQLSHGRGYGNLSLVLGILVVALIGPGFFTNVATATGVATDTVLVPQS